MVLFKFIKILKKYKLSPGQIEVILLQLASLTNDDIGKLNKVKTKSVKDLKYSARKKLKQEKYFSVYHFFIKCVYPNLSNQILAYLRGDLLEPVEDATKEDDETLTILTSGKLNEHRKACKSFKTKKAQ